MMFYHTVLKNYIYFSHIPRTGGRTVNKILQSNNFTPVMPVWHRKNNTNIRSINFCYKNQEFVHLDMDTFKDYSREYNVPVPVKKISIIRNPLDRFVSAAHYNLKKYVEKGYEWDFVINDLEIATKIIDNNLVNQIYLHKGLKNHPSNWYKNQTKFVDDTTFLWRFEDGFEEDFRECLSDYLNLQINPKSKEHIDYTRSSFDSKDKKFINMLLQRNVKDYIIVNYNNDYKLWQKLK